VIFVVAGFRSQSNNNNSLFAFPITNGIAHKKKTKKKKKKYKIKVAKAINPIPPKKIFILNGFLSCANFISKYTVNTVYSPSDLILHLFCKWHQKKHFDHFRQETVVRYLSPNFHTSSLITEEVSGGK